MSEPTLRVIGDNGALHHPRPLMETEDWRLKVSGEVENPGSFSLAELARLEAGGCTSTRLITCVSAANIVPGGGPISFTGIRFSTLARHVRPRRAGADDALPTVEFSSRAPGTLGPRELPHRTSLPYSDCDAGDQGVLLAWALNGATLPYANGGPLRSVAPPHLFFYKGIKWLAEIRFIHRPLADCLGTWEEHAGYHNRARVALNERFEPRMRKIVDVATAADGSLEEVTELVPEALWGATFRELFATRNLSRLVAAQLHKVVELPVDFSFCRFSDGPYCGKIRGTSFASADFSGAMLAGGNFSLSKFTNARFSRDGSDPADLSGADFEGAFFNRAHLQGVSLRGARLTNATFVSAAEADRPTDRVRGLDARGAINLAPQSAEWLRRNGALVD